MYQALLATDEVFVIPNEIFFLWYVITLQCLNFILYVPLTVNCSSFEDRKSLAYQILILNHDWIAKNIQSAFEGAEYRIVLLTICN